VFELEQIMIGAATIAEAERVLKHTTPPVIGSSLIAPAPARTRPGRSAA
jgi:hypothetical protein